jgi:hypothetical protein
MILPPGPTPWPLAGTRLHLRNLQRSDGSIPQQYSVQDGDELPEGPLEL